jgi:uncharacterized protein YijF (DUF1287 family)
MACDEVDLQIMKAFSCIFLGLLCTSLLAGIADRPQQGRISSSARAQIGKTVRYNPAYRVLRF